ncbi:MAG: DNA modification methylase, partial [Myxococcales bacterium]|nr:DNA modification methylase [Myxococcales bacterium]
MSQGSTTTRPAGETPRRIEYLPLGELEGTPGNPKLHDLDALKASIQRHGLAEVPLRDDRTGRIVAGHGRIDELRAQLLAGESPPDGVRLRADGEWLVPVLVGWRSKSDADAKHYVIASNQTTRAGGWDVGLFEAMAADALQSAEDLLAAGFGDLSLDAVLEQLRREAEDLGVLGLGPAPGGSALDEDPIHDDDDIPEPPAEPVTVIGEIVELGRHELRCDDCMAVLRSLDPDSIDAVVTDPPYGLSPDKIARTWDDIEALRAAGKGPKAGFMGSEWDAGVPGLTFARELFRVLKPGAHAVLFSSTRTIHRLTCALEDAGFHVRDQIDWLQWQGFPKSRDVARDIDELLGAKREVVGSKVVSGPAGSAGGYQNGIASLRGASSSSRTVPVTAPASDEAKRVAGWGTGLKPANEPAVLVRKPLEKGLTVAENVLKWGTGALNIDACRLAPGDPAWPGPEGEASHPLGLWPANVYACPKPSSREKE